MSWIDAIPIVVIPLYIVVGFFTGVIRRAIGFAAVYIACFAATSMGLQIADVLSTSFSNMSKPDGRIYGFFGILVAVILMIEGAAQLIHNQLDISAIALNRVMGLLVGIATGIALAVVPTLELVAAANPEGGAQLDSVQISVRDAVNNSKLAVPIANSIGKPLETLFKPVLPSNPHAYFGPGQVS